MKRRRHAVLPAAMFANLLLPVQAADRPVRLDVPPNLAKDLSAMPPIVGPVDDAERKINAALRRLDAKVQKAARECRAEGGADASWERNIDAAMRGPRFLSYVIYDSTFCGGVHPNVGTMSIVYDLATGAPVDWTSLLPSALTGTVALAEQADGSKVVTLASRRLFALYRERYRPKTGDPKIDDADQECRAAIAEPGTDGPPAMMVWLDAKEGGLALQFDLAHAVQACVDTVVVPTSVLRAEGAQAMLVDAIETAHAKR